ncbi:non-ribosomal peptide synthetase [Pollutimonas harenae]|uniref:Amino acid adenylation domain-containing protein n=1 Tax=Pollutimonas harenae TaxID=657015 RepID=A0A853H1I6_9BURK|nr:non-ribosomal peptide synthetase [Pollutimonas harenae]NYT86162.1 amino acid adenylation domain-containing protein [Pollutimonas harenae]TEA71199.1 amino acid adenylation domain-containing protein [Pollutimonas harenae]
MKVNDLIILSSDDPHFMQDRGHATPLTEAQEGLWYAQRLDPQNPIFNTGHCTEIKGSLELPEFMQAVGQTLREANALSLRFMDHESGPLQYFDAASTPSLEVVDLSAEPASTKMARAQMLRDLHTPIDPLVDALARHVLFIAGDHHYFWYQRIHHLAADGYGMSLIEKRVIQLYQALIEQGNQGTPLTPFEAVVKEDLAYRAGTRRVEDSGFWQDSLQQLDEVASLGAGTALTAHSILQARCILDNELVARLQRRQDEAQCSWPDLLTALVAAYVQRHTGQDTTVIGVPWMGRMGNASARSVATIMNVAPLKLNIDQCEPLDTFFRNVAKQLRLARKHGRYRSEQLRRDLNLLGGQRRLHGPLVNILPFDAPYGQSRLQARQEVLCAGPVEDLNFNFRAHADGSELRLELEANPKLYQQTDLDIHLERLVGFIDRALRAESLLAVETLGPAEARHWLYAVNQTEHDAPDTTLSALTTASCAAHPEREALRFDHHSITYREFETLVRRAATGLRQAGVKAGDIVAVALPRSDFMVMSLHAIMKAGAAYLPLDIEQPDERIARILNSAQPAAVIGDNSTWSRLAASSNALNVEALFATADTIPAWPEPAPQDPAYVLYTSGSTGEPKGVVVSHRAIVNRLLWMKNHYALGPGHCFLQKTPYTFDVSVWELFLPMLCGAPLVIALPGLHRDPHALAQFIRKARINVAHFVPSMLAAFLNEPGSAGLELEHVYCSGEALSAGLRDRFHTRIKSELHNLYGPTEAAVDVSYWRAHRDDTSDPLPIGLPVWNTQLYVLDRYLRPVPPGVAGTLYLGGRQLADGYLGRPDLTAERFVPDPFCTQPGARMYDTGDLARWRNDGAVVYLGRLDHQIKIRGQRIELGEVETVLSRYPACRELVVMAREDQPGQTRLVAYMAARAGHTMDPDSVLTYAREHLPDAMVPSAIIELDVLPVNANGKLDRKALPAPAFTAGTGRMAQTATEQTLARLFKKVLELNAEPAADDDFFSLGGHSLLAARLANLLRKQFSEALTLGAIFEHPTVSRLAAYLDRSDTMERPALGDGFGRHFILQPDTGQGRPALFCIHPAGGLSWCYGLLARQLSTTRAVHGVQSPWLGYDSTNINSLHELANRYADQIETMQSEGPYHLLGWSVGGIIAHEVACVLAERHRPVGVVCMLDAYPSEVWRARPEPAHDAAYKAIMHIAGYDPDALGAGKLNRKGVIEFLRGSGHALGELTDVQLDGIISSVEHSNALVRQHEHRFYNGPLLYYRAALDHQDEDLHPDMWRPWAANITVHDTASLHAHLTGEQATTQLLPTLDLALVRADSLTARGDYG